MTRYFILVLILFLGITELTAQTKSIRKTAALAETQPESAGVSTERLKRIDKMCEEAVAKVGFRELFHWWRETEK